MQGQTGAVSIEYVFLITLVLLMCLMSIMYIGQDIDSKLSNPELKQAMTGE